jgi:hypothetical protein
MAFVDAASAFQDASGSPAPALAASEASRRAERRRAGLMREL